MQSRTQDFPDAEEGGAGRRGSNPKGGANLLFSQLCWKLHENEENWTEGEGELFQNFTM